VPVVVLAVWLIPSDDPTTDVVGASEPAALADSSATESTSATAESSTTSTSSTSSTSSTTSPAATAETSSTSSTSTSLAEPQVDEADDEPEPETDPVPEPQKPDVSEPLSLGDQALLRVNYPWQEAFPDWDVVFRGPRGGIRALTYPQERRVEIFVRESDTVSSLHRVFAHELGHVVDIEMNSDDDRELWRAQRSIAESASWWPDAESPDFATGAGDFAEAFAVWETGVTTRSTVAGQPSVDDLSLLRELSEG